MTKDKSIFVSIDHWSEGFFTFGDGSKLKVFENGLVEAFNIPILDYILYVEGLKANLISIGQSYYDK